MDRRPANCEEAVSGDIHDVVLAVAIGTLPDDTLVVMSTDFGGTVQVWRLADGEPTGEPWRAHASVSALTVGALPDGVPVVACGCHDGTVQVWRLADGAPVGELLQLGHVHGLTWGAGTLVASGGFGIAALRLGEIGSGYNGVSKGGVAWPNS